MGIRDERRRWKRAKRVENELEIKTASEIKGEGSARNSQKQMAAYFKLVANDQCIQIMIAVLTNYRKKERKLKPRFTCGDSNC